MPSHARSSIIPLADSSLERAASVSSILSMNRPPCPGRGRPWRDARNSARWAKAQQKSAERAPPMWRWPVGEGAKRVMTGPLDALDIGRKGRGGGIVDLGLGLADWKTNEGIGMRGGACRGRGGVWYLLPPHGLRVGSGRGRLENAHERGEHRMIRTLVIMFAVGLVVSAASAAAAARRADGEERCAAPAAHRAPGDRLGEDGQGPFEAISRHRAEARSSPTVVIEPTGHRWREDVVGEMARVLTAEPRGTILVYLNGASGEAIGTGQAFFALIADAAYASPKARWRTPRRMRLDELAPAEGNPESIGETIARGRVAGGMSSRGVSPLLLTLCPRPRQSLWSVPSGENDGSWRLLAAALEPSGGARPLVVAHSARADLFTVTLNAEAMKSIGLVHDTRTDPATFSPNAT